MKYLLTYIILYLLSVNVLAQTTQDLEVFIEKYIEQKEEENINKSDLEILYEDILSLSENKININSATLATLDHIPFLNEIQKREIIKYKDIMKRIYTIDELRYLKTMDPLTFDLLSLCISIGELSLVTPKSRRSNTEIIAKIRTIKPKQLGFISTDDGKQYKGSAVQLYNRVKGNIKSIVNYGLVWEKDMGETFFAPSKKSIDHLAGFCKYEKRVKKKIETRTIVGDYHLRIGQGLAFWTGGGGGKSSEPKAIRRTAQGIRGYTSADENNFFRGIASEIGYKDFSLLLMGSWKSKDANVVSDETSQLFTSFHTSGFHRTEAERKKYKTVKENWFGGEVTYNHSWFRAGLYHFNGTWDLPCIPKPSYPETDRFEGDKVNYNGAHYLVVLNKMEVFGEFSSTNVKEISWINGLYANLHPRLKTTLTLRNYKPNHYNFYSNAFSESSNIQNERGIATSFIFLPINRVNITGYIDLFQNTMPTYNTVAPSKGNETLLNSDIKISRKFYINVRYKKEEKEEKTKALSNTYKQTDKTKSEIRINTRYKQSNNFEYQVRGEFCKYEKLPSESRGFLGFINVKYTSNKNATTIYGRTTYYNTDDYNARIYAYENDMLYQFSIPAFYGHGIKTYINAKVRITPGITAYSKISVDTKFDQSEIGSAFDKINGNTKIELKAMVRVKL